MRAQKRAAPVLVAYLTVDFFRALRPHQWAKNFLLFVPALAAHRFLDEGAWRQGGLAFVAFSLLASAVYLMNDLLDLEADRRHPWKKNRPFASGAVPTEAGFALVPLLASSAFLMARLLPLSFAYCLGAYALLNVAYSLRLKRLLLVDVVLLATFYGLRVIAGGAASGTYVSPWLLAFSTFFFFGLALLKRFAEVQRTRLAPSGRGYLASDALPLLVLGAVCSLLSAVVLALYINGRDTVQLYGHPERLWLLTPLLVYWNCRVWVLAHRGGVIDDPLLFALRDRASWAVAVAFAGVLLWAT